ILKEKTRAADPFGCSAKAPQLVMSFAVPPSSSRQPALSFLPLLSAPLRFARLRRVDCFLMVCSAWQMLIALRSAAKTPPAAHVCARLRVAAGCGLTLFICLRCALAIKAVSLVCAFPGCHGFCEKTKT